MNDKFGQFDWKCFKDEEPEYGRFVYAYMPWGEESIDIGKAEDFNFRDTDYWCYVFIPDAPKIEQKEDKDVCIFKEVSSIQFFIRYIYKDLIDASNKIDKLEKKQEMRIDKIEHTLNNLCKILKKE